MGAETFRLCRELVDGIVLVDNAAVSAAIKVRGGAGCAGVCGVGYVVLCCGVVIVW